MKDSRDDGIIDQTRALYGQLSGEARRLAERDRQAARRRGPLTKALWGACVVACLLAAGTLVYGFVSFPDAPVRPAAGGYAGKHGAPYTREGYERFKLWEKLLLAGSGLVVLTGGGALISEKIDRREKRQ